MKCDYCKYAFKCSEGKKLYNEGHCRWYVYDIHKDSGIYHRCIGFGELNIIQRGKNYK